ncbi:MAG: hypothetical protein HY748_13270 [Elusimicrobia bacterium]|nr:hypothetical protein [Elusimicrobiota bacterium]
MNARGIVLTTSCVLSAAWGPGVPAAAAQSGKPTPEEIRRFMSQPQLQLRSYDFDPTTPLESRIGPCPAFLLDVMRQMDQRPDYEAYEPTREERRVLAGYLNGLPAGMRKAFQERLVGIFFVKPFTGNGLGNWLVDEDKNIYATIILNPAGFDRGLSEVLTSRDASAFKGDGGVRFDCGDKYKGLLYALLHEGTHVYDYIRGITPYTDETTAYMLREGRGNDAKWDVWDGYSKPRKDADFPLRAKLRFFGLGGEPALEAKDAAELYAQLAASPFASLYGSQSWAEDAADMGVFYHVTQVLKQPCEVTVPSADRAKPLRFKVLGSKRTLERARRIYRRLEK